MSDDEETRADFWDRERTERDKARTREVANPVGSSIVVAHWACRREGCPELVGVTQSALDSVSVFNGILAKRGEERLDMARIVFCPACEKALRAGEGERTQKRMAEVADLTSQLRQSPAPLRETNIRSKLEKLIGKVDADALAFAIMNKRNGDAAPTKRVGREAMR